jgi:diguanylate cyclase
MHTSKSDMAGTVSRIEDAPQRRPGVPLTATAAGPLDIPVSDWDALFHAVCTRLAQRVGDVATIETRNGVLECVAALEQLHGHLAQERARQREQELQLFKLRASLAKTRSELVGIRGNERRSRRLALHDPLTTLPNRNFFSEWLDHALVKSDGLPPPLAVLFLDLDGFKHINDHHGHGVGDELLCIVASRLARAVRAEDVVSRLGGDEFACAMTGVSARSQVGELARKLVELVSAPIRIGPRDVAVRASIGIAMCPDDGVTPEVLLRSADAAMYHAKRQGSGLAFFDESCTGATAARASRRADVGR